MIIEVDTEVLRKSNISILQYFIGYFLLTKEFKKLAKLITEEIGFDIFKTLIADLESKSFMHNMNDNTQKEWSYDSIIVRNKFIELVKDYQAEDMFDELLKIYPIKVQRPDGNMDYLRTDVARCRKMYNNTIIKKSFKKHEDIIKALKFEIEIRKKEDSLKYMKRLPKWLASEDWKVFEERMKDMKTTVESEAYGTELE